MNEKTTLKKFNLGKFVKKWLGQNVDIEDVAKKARVSVEEASNAYLKYIGKVPMKLDLVTLIRNKKKIHVYGNVGSGKSFAVKNIVEDLGLKLVISYPRSEEDLSGDFGDLPFQKDVKAVFVMEGDGYYWKRYGLVKKYIEDSKCAFIVVTRGKETPTKNVTKLVEQIKIFTPTRAEVLDYIKTLKPDWDGDIQEIYSSDWREVLRNVRFGKRKDIISNAETIDSKTLSYKLIKGNAEIEDFEKCSHPISFTINWIAYNIGEFWSGSDLEYNTEILSWCDANKYYIKPIYIYSALLLLKSSKKKGFMKFPPYKDKKLTEEVEEVESEYKITHFKKKKESKIKAEKHEEYKGLSGDKSLGGFLMI